MKNLFILPVFPKSVIFFLKTHNRHDDEQESCMQNACKTNRLTCIGTRNQRKQVIWILDQQQMCIPTGRSWSSGILKEWNSEQHDECNIWYTKGIEPKRLFLVSYTLLPNQGKNACMQKNIFNMLLKLFIDPKARGLYKSSVQDCHVKLLFKWWTENSWTNTRSI